MFLFIRDHVTVVNVILTLGLVFAMTGAAYAGSKYLITSTKQISPKVLKQLKGASGAAGKTGAAGPAGTTGPTGPAGPAGPGGSVGHEGAAGKDGAAGESVSYKEVSTSNKAKCGGLGGAEYTVGGKTTLVCNGETGFTETLPVGKTEKGEWNVTTTNEIAGTAISFAIPLAKALESTHAHFIGAGEGEGESKPAAAITSHECEGTYIDPKAASGQLCVFVKSISKYISAFFPITALEANGGADTSGTQMEFFSEEAPGSPFIGTGSWAVTG